MATDLSSNVDARLATAFAAASSYLIPGEQVEARSAQIRLAALFHRRILVLATSGRLIVIRRGLFSGLKMNDVRWQDLKDAQIEEHIIGATLRFSASGQVLEVDGLKKVTARTVYVFAQSQEQAWREKNRVRHLEESRASSGGVQIGGAVMAGDGGALTPAARLDQAKLMRERGLITDAEYEAIKAKVFGAL